MHILRSRPVTALLPPALMETAWQVFFFSTGCVRFGGLLLVAVGVSSACPVAVRIPLQLSFALAILSSTCVVKLPGIVKHGLCALPHSMYRMV